MEKAATFMYWDDLKVGDEFVTPSRTVTETDLMVYTYLSGDFNVLHTDAEYCKSHPFKERIFHGPCGISFTHGLVSRLGIFEGGVIGLLEMTWKYFIPLKIGDTIHVLLTIADKRETKKPDTGLVITGRKLINQRGETIQEGQTKMLMRRRPAQE